MAVRLPEPRKFAMHDLVSIVIREETRADSTSELEVEKDFKLEGQIKDFPSLQIKDLIQAQLRPSSASGNPPKVGIEMNRQFEGEGDYRRQDSFVGRITARVIDVKPNGLLVLEARKYIKNDEETQMMRLTGTCRADDVAADNTVLSTQLFDLNLVKEHTGQLRKTTKKGLLTNIFEAIFNF
jgi:flagellar L-ring protein precursor FlgH